MRYYNVECIMQGEVYGVIMPENEGLSQYNKHKFEISKEKTLRIRGSSKPERNQQILADAKQKIANCLKKKFKDFEIVIPRESSQFAHLKTKELSFPNLRSSATWGVTDILAVNGTDVKEEGHLE